LLLTFEVVENVVRLNETHADGLECDQGKWR
jgi:hypothetical protein